MPILTGEKTCPASSVRRIGVVVALTRNDASDFGAVYSPIVSGRSEDVWVVDVDSTDRRAIVTNPDPRPTAG